jgi:aldose 1-epimerase
VTANGGPYFGELIGRYGNRIAKGTFTLDQPGVGPVTYTCRSTTTATACTAASSASATTSGRPRKSRRAAHVGPNGDATLIGSPGCPNGDQGYPATLKDVTTFTLNNRNQLGSTTSDDESTNLNTVTNVTNHAYFNLAGEASPAGSAYGQLCRSTRQVHADRH